MTAQRLNMPRECRPSGTDAEDYVAIVRDYIRTRRESAKRELRFFEIQRSLGDTVRLASLAQGPGGKRLSHQRRIPGRVLNRVREVLESALTDLGASSNFDELHARIAALIGHIPGVGELMVYDTALRIGAKLGVEPDYVYLHAGTRTGARALGIDPKQKKVPLAALPVAFRKQRAAEAEDVLCIYKEQLRDLGSHD